MHKAFWFFLENVGILFFFFCVCVCVLAHFFYHFSPDNYKKERERERKKKGSAHTVMCNVQGLDLDANQRIDSCRDSRHTIAARIKVDSRERYHD